jgi:phenylalanyl-tRNA synthetase beta chain
MRVPLDWLREHCDPPLGVGEVSERLTMTGTKVEAVHHHGVGAAENFVVGRVLEVAPHERADRLKVCTVDVGGERGAQPATIVCGAPNVAAGQSVAVARPGAVLPDGSQLRSVSLRGVVSEGMILSANELGLGSDGSGILVLDDLTLDAEFAPGAPLADVLPISTDVLDLEITSNRPDCLGVFGVARELHAATGAPLSPLPWEQDPGSPGAPPGAQVTVACPDLCRRFTARVFAEVSIGPSPPWLAARLIAAGQRPINNVVDITNYVMLLTAQPMHAFDLDRVRDGRLVVRRAREGEQVRTLDGSTRTLDAQVLLIEDADGPTSIAGLMGGERSEVAPGTRRVLLEAATWDGPNIHRSSARLGLRSEASTRFEKGLQPEQCMHAQAVAARLMQSLCGARLLDGTIDEAWSPQPAHTLRLRDARVQAILGVAVPRAREREILQALDFQCSDEDDGLRATVPALRRDDVTREIDLIEEVARIHGLEHIPATLPARRGAAGRLTREQRLRRAAEDALAGRGLYEIAGWSFCGPDLLDRLLLPAGHELRAVVRVANPLSEAHSIMRPTLLGSLLDAARHNVFHNGPRIALFESGTVFRQGHSADGLADERHELAAVLAGPLTPRTWRGAVVEADFFAAKALLEAMLGRLGVPLGVERAQRPFLHPGRSAAVRAGADGAELGFLGELHPLVAEAWELPRAAAFSVDLGEVARAAPEAVTFRPYASVPPLRLDIAVVLPDSVSAGQALAAVRGAGGEVLESVNVFDSYSGEQVGKGKRSLALALSFRASHETLSDDDIAPVRDRIVAALRDLGGELRG